MAQLLTRNAILAFVIVISSLQLATNATTTTSSSSRVSPTGFSWPSYEELKYATPLPKPTTTTTYAPPYSKLASLAGPQTTTTWASISNPLDPDEGYGNLAWSSLWMPFSVDPPPFTTTASPTPVPSSQLVKPTPLPFSVGNGKTDKLRFPKDFEWGFTGSAMQVEGATKSEGRGPSVVEFTIGRGRPESPGAGPPDISTLNYFLYKQDIARLAALGVKSYGFSISWSRILPFAVPGSPVNQEAIDHYDDLINTVIEYGMKPVVTLSHFDVPLHYLNLTSWQGYESPDFVDGFVNYAKIVLTHYSDRVGTWISFNEPNIDSAIVKNWKSSYNVVMAHAKTVHFYREEIKGSGKWSIKLAFPGGFPLPLDPHNPDDVAATRRQLDASFTYMANPIYLGAQVPTSILDTLKSRAPNYTDEELEYVGGTADFLAVDIYSAIYATTLDEGTDECLGYSSHPQYPACVNLTSIRGNWQIGAQTNSTLWTWYQHARTIFKYLDTTYPTAGGISIAEFGWPSSHEADMSVDQARAELMPTFYYLSVLNEVLKSIHEDGVKFQGTLGWAFVDNWEWGEYNDRYGVQNFNRDTLERSYKRSIFDIVDFINDRS
ncbi:glycoside hydrolase family 1 protein [Hypomontagnella monticulosa]|nr:glycoside hydrolase family 1 protein [Hypomontagnella monticulosa]